MQGLQRRINPLTLRQDNRPVLTHRNRGQDKIAQNAEKEEGKMKRFMDGMIKINGEGEISPCTVGEFLDMYFFLDWANCDSSIWVDPLMKEAVPSC